MFYSLMAILHEKLPCAAGFFRGRRKFREDNGRLLDGATSPVAQIASPKMIRGLSIPKRVGSNRQLDLGSKGGDNKEAFDIRIKNHKQGSTRSIHSRTGSGAVG